MSYRTTSMRAAGTAFVLAALLAVPFAATAGATQHANPPGTPGTPTATAKMSPPEKPGGAHEHTEWPEDGQLHQDCGPYGPWSGDQENCPDDDDDAAAPPGDPQYGGPGERIAVGRGPDEAVARSRAEGKADDVCHGDWDLRDFDVDIALGEPTVYTLTYECA
jgi:hypothetical protein